MNTYRLIFTAPLLLTLMLNGCAIIKYEPLPPERELPSSAQQAPRTSQPANEIESEPVIIEESIKEVVIEQPGQLPPTYYNSGGGAGIALFEEGQKHLRAGNLDKAEMIIERALRIEPNNGYYWYAMAEAKYRQNKHSQAAQFAYKSKSLAKGDPQLLKLNDQLLQLIR